MKKSKKMISAMLAAAMCVSLMAPAMAVPKDNANQILSANNETSQINASRQLDKIVPWFGAAPQKNSTADAISIVYDYEIDSEIDANGQMDASMDFEMRKGTATIPVHVEGKLDVTELNESRTYVLGPLYGEITVGGKGYEVIVGFQKILEEEPISAGVTIDSMDNSSVEGLVAFFFGDFVKSEDILALEETDAEPEEVVATPFAVKPLEPSAEDYQYVGYDFTKMSGTSTIDQKLKTYWNSRENVIAALTWTNLSDIKPLMKMDHAIMTSAKVSVVRTDFELNQNVNRAAFDRWYNFEDEKNNADLNTVFAEVFLSLGYIGEIGGTAYDIVMNGDLSSAADSNGQWRYYTVISNKNGMHYDETPLPIAAVCDTTLAGNYSITVTTQTTYAFTFDLGTLYHTTGIADDTHNYYISE